MKDVPNIITCKDLLYIEDMMNWNYVLNNKIYYYMDNITDSDCLKLLNKALKMHQNHYKILLDILC